MPLPAACVRAAAVCCCSSAHRLISCSSIPTIEVYDATLEYAFRSEARCCCCCCAAAAAAASACCARLFAFVEPLGRPRPRFTTSPPGPRVGDDFAAFSNGSPGRGRFCGLRRPCAANEAVDGRSSWSGFGDGAIGRSQPNSTSGGGRWGGERKIELKDDDSHYVFGFGNFRKSGKKVSVLIWS